MRWERVVMVLPVALLVGCGGAGSGSSVGVVTSDSVGAAQSDDTEQDVREAIRGTWYPSRIVGYTVSALDEPTYRKAYLEFGDGGWNGSDGCNGLSGTYDLDADGSFDVTAGAATEIGCANVPHLDVLDRTTDVRVQAGTLIFRAGEEIARYTRTRPGPTTGDAEETVGKRTAPATPPPAEPGTASTDPATHTAAPERSAEASVHKFTEPNVPPTP